MHHFAATLSEQIRVSCWTLLNLDICRDSYNTTLLRCVESSVATSITRLVVHSSENANSRDPDNLGKGRIAAI